MDEKSADVTCCLYDAKTHEEISLAMQSLWLTGEILPFGARLLVRHDFQSGLDRPVEAVYSFMLPRDGVLKKFIVKGEHFSVESELRERKDAEKIYEEGIEKGHLSVLSSEYADGMINLRVGNIMPQEKVTVTLEMLAGVDCSDNGYRFRFPFTLAPSYHARAAYMETSANCGEIVLPEDEFSDLLLPSYFKNAQSLHKIGFDLLVNLPDEISQVSSPSHPVSVKKVDKGKFAVSLSTAGDMPNRDLVLDVLAAVPVTTVNAAVDQANRVSFSVLIPSIEFGRREDGPKKCVFLLDRSGSMEGLPLQQAKEAIGACIGCLSEEDSFSLIAFDDTVKLFSQTLLPGSDKNREELKRFLGCIQANGGTELANGIKQAAAMLGEGGGDIMLITDGQVMGGEEILKAVSKLPVRIHCLGIGSASQDRFLSTFARQTQGQCTFLTPRERIDTAAVRLFGSICAPIATGVKVILAGSATGTLDADTADIVFEDSCLAVHGSLGLDEQAVLELTWSCSHESRNKKVLIERNDAIKGETLRLLRGARLISRCQNLFDGNTEKEKKRHAKQLLSLSREYGLASQEMSLVAVINREKDKKGVMPQTLVVPVGMPQDVQFASYFQAHAPSADFAGLSAMCMDPRAGINKVMVIRNFIRAPRFSENQSLAESCPTFRQNLSVNLASRLLADGGLAGASIQERLIFSLVFLLYLLGEGHSEFRGSFKRHVKRLRAFMAAADKQALPEQLNQAIEKGMALLSQNHLNGNYEPLAEKVLANEEIGIGDLLHILEAE